LGEKDARRLEKSSFKKKKARYKDSLGVLVTCGGSEKFKSGGQKKRVWTPILGTIREKISGRPLETRGSENCNEVAQDKKIEDYVVKGRRKSRIASGDI